MAGHILFLVHRLNTALEQQVRARMSERFGLTTTQALVLNFMLQQNGEPVCAVDLHRHLGTSKAALSAALKDLHQQGFLTVTSCPGDDRKKQIRPTDKAAALQRQIQEQMAGLEQQACRGLTPGQADAVKLCMEQMLRNLGGPAEDRSSRDGRKIQC
ncbi:MarR family transcriptional regulator [Faecalibacterium sp. An192]|uniref:MarR family winged helix-turn-helix transcriptional regulator n=1 Tax=Faecalibacterium sp. An192 TaxID=1965581 RepID=UPI001302B7A1|nr:MarR family transcriptional regulator [Faecalibacterium sp. An192]